MTTTAAQRRRSRPTSPPVNNAFDELPLALTVDGVCRVLDLSEPALRRWIALGTLRVVRAGTSVRVLRADLADFLRRAPETAR